MSDEGPEFYETASIVTITPGAFGIPSPRPKGIEISAAELNARTEGARILGVGAQGMSWKAGADLLWIHRGRCLFVRGWFDRG